MKKHSMCILLFVSILNVICYAVNKILLKDSIDFDEMLAKNNVYLKMSMTFDADDGFIYFLDSRYGMVFKVEERTGKLVKSISSKGQGPFELINPTYIRVRNRKIFIVDSGFNGIRIFDTEGNRIKEIKLSMSIGLSTIDVNEKDEIFLGRCDSKNNKLVSIYNMKGEKLRSMAPINYGKKVDRLSRYWYYNIRLDKIGNIYVLFNYLRKLSKYDHNGKLLWEIPVKNEILDKYPNRDEIKGGPKKTIHFRSAVFCLDVTPQNNVIVGHIYGGCIFSSNGKLKSLIMFEKARNIGFVRVLDDRLINLLVFGNTIDIYPFKED